MAIPFSEGAVGAVCTVTQQLQLGRARLLYIGDTMLRTNLGYALTHKSGRREQFLRFATQSATAVTAPPLLDKRRRGSVFMLAIRKLMQVAGDPVLQPVCPSCGRTLRLSRISLGTRSLPEQHTYSYQPCGVWVTEAADTAYAGPRSLISEQCGVQRVVTTMVSPEPL